MRVPLGLTATASGLLPTAIGGPITVFVAVSMTDTLLPLKLATYTRVPSGVIAKPAGAAPTVTVALTLLLAALMTETELPPLLLTYTNAPFGLTAATKGKVPTLTVATTELVLVSMTETLLLLMLVT